MNIRADVLLFFMQIAVNTGNNYFELCSIFGKIMSFRNYSNSQLRFQTRKIKINYWRLQILGNTGPKNMSSNVCNSLKYGKVSRRDPLCKKM